jgi:hypothetical protein
MRTTQPPTPASPPSPPAPLGSLADPESLEQLIGDCRRMAAHWTAAPAAKAQARVTPAGLHGITVSPASAHAVSGMAEYGA